MQLDNYTVRVQAGPPYFNRLDRENKDTGYVYLNDGQTYSLELINANNVKCDADIRIDGKFVGLFRVNARSQIRIERPINENGLFTFFKNGTTGFKESSLDNISQNDLGLVQVTFKPEKVYIPPVKKICCKALKRQLPSTNDFNLREQVGVGNFACNTLLENFTSGGTGLTGNSSQQFVDTYAISCVDPTEFIQINLRLVAIKKFTRPLFCGKSTPVPDPAN